jgi:hypothetical protein
MPPTRSRQPRFHFFNGHRFQHQVKPLVEAANTTIEDEEKYQSDMPDEHAPEEEKQNVCDSDEGTPTISNGDADMYGVTAAEPQPDVPGRTLEFQDDSTTHESTGGLKDSCAENFSDDDFVAGIPGLRLQRYYFVDSTRVLQDVLTRRNQTTQQSQVLLSAAVGAPLLLLFGFQQNYYKTRSNEGIAATIYWQVNWPMGSI